MATAVFNRSTPPVRTPIVGSDGNMPSPWLQWFSARQTLDNSLQARWISSGLTTGLVVIDPTTIERLGTSGEDIPMMFPAGTRIRVRESGNIIEGTVSSCSYDSGSTTLTIVAIMDDGIPLTSVDRLYYSVLTSSVIS